MSDDRPEAHRRNSGRREIIAMMLKKLIPNLMVQDVNRTIEFYQVFLGFELVQTVPEAGQFEWASMQCGAVEIMFQAESSLTQDIPALRGMEMEGR